jgi:uncharacterized Zn-binding protein involved in type VI secretion
MKSVSGSPDCFINNLPAIRLNDKWDGHVSKGHAHDAFQIKGSNTVFVNNRPLARIGDNISCGDIVAQGSPNVFAG